jgi:hypothetical protein
VIIFSYLIFALFLWLLHKSSLLLADSICTYFIYLFLGLVVLTIPCGYVLSEFNAIGKPWVWGSVLSILAAMLFWLLTKRGLKQSKSLGYLFGNSKNYLLSIYKDMPFVEKGLFGILALGLLVCSLINIFVLFYTYPNEWDSMTGHLVKCAYYLQNGNMDRVSATTWSVDFYPNSLPSLQILGYHIFGEKGFKLIHYLSYWIFVLTSYGITKEAFGTKKGAIFVGLLAGLLPPALIQAVTTETDIVQSAYLGLVVYFLLKVYKETSYRNILLFALSVSVWVSHKVTFLLIGPAVAVISLYFFKKKPEIRKRALPTIVLILVGFSVYVLPNGYVGNVKEVGKFSLGALSAPEEVMKWHGIENYSKVDKIKNFQFNILRYSSDFLQLDGIRNTAIGNDLNESFRSLPNKFFNKFALERKMYWVVYPFEMMGNRQIHYNKERPYWGVISFMLVVPVLFIIMLLGRKRDNSDEYKLAIVFAFAGLIHFLSLCFSAPYDPIKGRYFMNMAVWFLPLLAWFFKIKRGKTYLLLCSIIIVITGLLTLTHRGLYPLVGENNVFELDRIAQLNSSRPEGTEAYRNFDKRVPENAIVALGTQQEHDDYVYPLWGKSFKRKLIPIHPFRSPVKPIPKEAEFLFYSEGVLPFEEGDIQLNEGDIEDDTPVMESTFFLRKL